MEDLELLHGALQFLNQKLEITEVVDYSYMCRNKRPEFTAWLLEVKEVKKLLYSIALKDPIFASELILVICPSAPIG